MRNNAKHNTSLTVASLANLPYNYAGKICVSGPWLLSNRCNLRTFPPLHHAYKSVKSTQKKLLPYLHVQYASSGGRFLSGEIYRPVARRFPWQFGEAMHTACMHTCGHVITVVKQIHKVICHILGGWATAPLAHCLWDCMFGKECASFFSPSCTVCLTPPSTLYMSYADGLLFD